MPSVEKTTLGAGCFWCVEAVFQRLKGVLKVESGYAGGQTTHPSYQDICTGETGHAEVIQIDFNPEVIAFETLLDVFFHVHNPTTLNRQGHDTGTQYRSVIFYHSETQRRQAEEAKQGADASSEWEQPIVTEISEMGDFYPAELEHNNYFNDNRFQPYCRAVISPKLSDFQKRYKDLVEPI